MGIGKNIRGRNKHAQYRRELLRKPMLEPLEPRRLLSVNVLTWHNDNTRQGLNANEVVLTPANVNASTFGELLSYAVTGQVYAQPLYVSNLAIPGKGTHNVVFVATENNDVYAFDANSNAGTSAGLLWHVNLGLAAATPNSFFANRYGPYHDIDPQVGITSTPVIDLTTDTMYVDAFTNDVAGQNVYSHHIHALDITTGQDKIAPMLVSAAVKGNGVEGNGTTITFDAEQQLQRPALTLLNGVLYVTYGSYADTDPYHGWVLGFNPTTLQLVSVLNDTPNLLSTPASSTADEGGIWQSGAGLASDGTNLFLLVGNGDFDAALGDYGDSVLKLATDSSTQANPNINGYGLKVADYFTPNNQLALSNADEDLGSGGGMVLPDQPGAHPHEFIGSGKQGVVYVINRDNMGQYNSSTDNVIQEVSLGHGNWDSPAYFNETVYYHAVGDVLKAYSLTNGLLSPAPVEQSAISYSGQGATPSISSDGAANGIVWEVQYDGSHQVLHAYDAATLAELYNSNQNTARDQMGAGVKFITPTIADGEVFVGSSNALTIYGLLTPPTTAPAAPTALTASATSAASITLNWVNNANNQAGFKIERSTGNTSNFAQIAVAGVSATSFIDSTVSPSTLYYYRVRATNIVGDSSYTNIASATTPAITGAIDVYHFDEGTGTTAADSVGSDNGTLSGGTLPQWVTPGKIGSAALAFSGDGTYNQTASESAVKVANDLSPVLGSTSTLDVWVDTLQVGNATHWMAPAITGVEQSGAGNDINWGTLDASGHIGIYVGDGGGVYSTMPINDGHWHNIAMTRDATTGKVQLFVDGVLNGTGTFDTGNKTSQFFLIGALSDVASDGKTRTGDNYFNGRLDEVRIYNQVLGANEIAGLAMIPAAPTLVSATAASGSVVQLTWTVPSSFTQYIEVDRKAGASGVYAPVVTLSGGVTSYMDQNLTAGVQYYYEIKAIDLAGTSPVSNELSVTPPRPTIVGNFIFYNNSVFDGYNGSSNLTDDNAIATDKSALLPNQAATFANYTSYVNGINGIIIDVANLPTVPTADDFDFAVGNDNDVSAWAPAPDPTYVNAYPGRGPGGSTQITLIWDDGAIVNEWLQVTMLANQVTGLAADDVFYFGNAIGETGDSSSDALVTASDAARVSANQTNNALVTNPYDINRDGVVDATDVALVNSHLTTASDGLKLISLVPPTVATAASASPNLVTGTTTALSILGADIAGESGLTYAWATTGTPPAAVTFSDNNSHSAKNTIATFTRAGNYSFIATISDAGGSTVTSTVDVTVEQTLSSLMVTPELPVLAGGATEQFSAGGLDQFSQPMAISPTWSVVGGGSIGVNGLYTPPYADGSATVQAASGVVTGTTSVTYSGQAEWNSSTDGSWSTNGNWKDTASGTSITPPGLRGVGGDTILFGSATGSTVRLDGADPSITAIAFDNSSTSFTISQGTGGVLHLANSGGSASITVSSGSHTISAPVELDSSLVLLPAVGSQLTIDGGIIGVAALAVDNRGTVVLSGTNGYTGGTTVSAGTLILTGAAAIAANTGLTIGAGASLIFAPSAPSTAATAAPLIAGSKDTTARYATVTSNAADIVHTRSAGNDSRSLIVPRAVERFIAPSIATRIAADLAWLGQDGNSSDDSNQHRKKDVATLALQAAFAQYGR
jgi:autotransporter-associated beta strand protein